MTDSKIDRPFPDDETLRGTLQAAFKATFGRAGCDEPDWEPLERALPVAECSGFMFMGYSDERAGIRLYKHGITRRYLALDERARDVTPRGIPGHEDRAGMRCGGAPASGRAPALPRSACRHQSTPIIEC